MRSGEFDFFLIRPISPLFRSLAGSPDFNDVLLFIPLTIFSAWYIAVALPHLTLQHVMLYLLLLANGLLISLAFHIFVLCVGIVSTEIDNTIMLYRDLSKMGQFPMEIYREPLRGIITFVIPVGIMMSVPAKVLLSFSSGQLIVISIELGFLCFCYHYLLGIKHSKDTLRLELSVVHLTRYANLLHPHIRLSSEQIGFERIAGDYEARGYTIAKSWKTADEIIVNTVPFVNVPNIARVHSFLMLPNTFNY